MGDCASRGRVDLGFLQAAALALILVRPRSATYVVGARHLDRSELASEPDRGGLRAAIDEPLLAEAKLAAPRQRAGIVARPRILRTLDGSEDSVLTLVAAPPGYGKSTAVRDWVASRDTAFAWVTLDEGDSDPVRLWRYVTTAIGRVLPGVPHPVQRA